MEQHVESEVCSGVHFKQETQAFLSAAISKLYPAGFSPIDEDELDENFMSHNLLMHPRYGRVLLVGIPLIGISEIWFKYKRT